MAPHARADHRLQGKVGAASASYWPRGRMLPAGFGALESRRCQALLQRSDAARDARGLDSPPAYSGCCSLAVVNGFRDSSWRGDPRDFDRSRCSRTAVHDRDVSRPRPGSDAMRRSGARAIRRRRRFLAPSRDVPEAPLRLRADALVAHEASHAVASARDATLLESRVDPRRPVDLAALLVDSSNGLRELCVGFVAQAAGPSSPGVVAAARDAELLTHRPDPDLPAVGIQEPEPQLSSSAKKASAFFSMSRSSGTRRSFVSKLGDLRARRLVYIELVRPSAAAA